ncbi:hypothetical protein D9M71_759550 [compost metagenome]
MLMNFSPLPMAFRPRYSTKAAGRKNSRLPMAGLMPKNSLRILPLPLMYAVRAPMLLTATDRKIAQAPNEPT